MDIFPSVSTKNYAELRNEIKSGDILLCSGNSFFSNLIREATQSVWSHVGFILRVDHIDRIMLFESVESIGVRAVSLSSYLNNYNGTGQPYPGSMLIARHADVKPENIKNLSRYAIDLLGSTYNTEEIIHIASRISLCSMNGITHLAKQPPQRAFICSEYAYACFQSIGIEIEYGPLGFITPADFARCQKVKALAFLGEKNKETSFINNT